MEKKINSGVTKDTAINEVIEKYPDTISIFQQYGLHCIGCPLAQAETIEEACQVHKIDLKKILKDLNKTIRADTN